MVISKNQPRGSAILTTIFILFGILTVAMIGLEIIMTGLSARRAQGASVRAFYAAEAGAERALTRFKTSGDDLFASCASATGSYSYLDFTSQPARCLSTAILCSLAGAADNCSNSPSPDLPAYWVKVAIPSGNRNVSLLARGNYLGTNRDLFIKFCLPTCQGLGSGADDGCGGICK